MSSEGIMSFLSLNRSLTNLGDESRHFRLPRMNPFPKLDGRVVRETCTMTQRSASQHVARGAVIIGGQVGSLPEMASDVIDASANYAAENVKRDRSRARLWLGAGLGHLVGRMLGSHRAARP
jgi:hypothetical protein